MANLFLLFITFIWGATFSLTKGALTHVSVYPFLFVRFLLASVALLCVCLASTEHRKAFTKKVWGAGTGLGLLLFGAYAFQTLGLVTVSPSVTGFLTGLNVVLVPIFAIPLLRQMPRWRVSVGAILAAFGLALVSGGDLLHLHIGDVYVLICAVCLALQILFVEKYGAETDALALATVEILVVTLCSLVASRWNPVAPFGSIRVWTSPPVLWALVVNGFLGTALAYWGQNVCQKFTSSGEIAILFSMEPVFAALIAWITLGDALSGQGIAGGICIVVSMLIADPAVKLRARWWMERAGRRHAE